MIFEGFEIHAEPYIRKAICKNCRGEMTEVSNGWLSSALFCSKCEKVYCLKLVKVPDSKITKEYLEQCRKEANPPSEK